MVCKKCGAETLEGALFCGSCGARLDGKKPCISCQQLNDENSAYCVFCGTRIDGKKTCSRCGTAYEGKFCPGCGYGEEAKKPVNPKTAPLGEDKGDGKKWTLKRILNFSASCLGLLGVLFALIFTFFIGVSQKTAGVKTTTGKSTLFMAQNIFYFFGGFFKDAKALNLSGNHTLMGSMTSITVYTYGILGMVIALTTIALVVTFATMAIVKFTMAMMGATKKYTDKWSVLTICAFFFGTGAFYGLHRYTTQMSAVTESASVGIALKGGVTAGIVVCAILLGLFAVCKIVAQGKALFKVQTIVKLILGVLGVAFISVVFICVRNAGISCSFMAGEMETKGGFTVFLYSLAIPTIFGYADVTNKEIETKIESAVIFGNLAQIIIVVALIFVAFSLCMKLMSVAGSQKSCAGIGAGITAFVLLIVALVFAIISINAMEAIRELSMAQIPSLDGGLGDLGVLEGILGGALSSILSFELKSTGIVVALIFAGLNLGLSIAQAVLNVFAKRRSDNE